MPWKPMWLGLTTLLVSSCAGGVGTSAPARDYCLLSKPILVSRQDFLTKGTATQILAQNETWHKLCR